MVGFICNEDVGLIVVDELLGLLPGLDVGFVVGCGIVEDAVEDVEVDLMVFDIIVGGWCFFVCLFVWTF